MDYELLKQWPILLLVVIIVGPLLGVIQKLYERLLSEAIAVRDKRIEEQTKQLERQTAAFERLADLLEPNLPRRGGA